VKDVFANKIFWALISLGGACVPLRLDSEQTGEFSDFPSEFALAPKLGRSTTH
jgi:hypothetical protein